MWYLVYYINGGILVGVFYVIELFLVFGIGVYV